MKNKVKPNLEQLDDRIVPSTIHGSTPSGLTWSYNDVTQKLVINGTSHNDTFSLWNGGQDVWLVDGNSGGRAFDTGAKLGLSLKIQVNDGASGAVKNDWIADYLPYYTYGSCVISDSNSGNEILQAGSYKDTLIGGEGNNCLIDGFDISAAGATLVGGTGVNTFITSTGAFGSTQVVDYDPTQDTIINMNPYQGNSMYISGGDPMTVTLNGQIVWQSV